MDVINSPFSLLDETKQFTLSQGFLPHGDPLQELPDACFSWETLALDLPKLLTSHHTRRSIESLPPFPMEALHNLAEVERAMLILSYLGHAYVWNSTQKPPTHLPRVLAVAWHAVAKKLGRPPVLSYASYALYNWFRLQPQQGIELGNIALLQNFLGGIDEEWFILVHVDIEAKAARGLAVMPAAQRAAQEEDTLSLGKLLHTMAETLNAMCKVLDRMPEHCDPYIYYNRVRPYIHGWKANPALPNGLIYDGVAEYQNKPQQFKGETGAQSVIIPCFDAILGIQHQESPLKIHLDEMRDYVPPQHREFLVFLEQGTSVRDFILKVKTSHPELKDTYNACIELLHRFRQTHINYAAHYIQKQAQTSAANPTDIGTGGTPFMQYLKEHVDETVAFLIP